MNSLNAMEDIGDRCKEVIVCSDPAALGRETAVLFTELARKAARERDRFTVALSGGSTPRILYRALTGSPFIEKIPWEQVHLFWGDERFVPPDHPDANYRMVYEILISKIPIPKENVHRMPCEGSVPQTAAAEYEERLRSFFGISGKGTPSFDLALLGIGTDGHTASLFPGSSALAEKERWVVAPYVEKLKSTRLTLTVPVFNDALHVVFIVSGKEKASIMKELLDVADPQCRYPAALIRPRRGKRRFYLDKPAAG
ncbi:MAG: 6-phosphogluconolactonase [Nitrospiria bacterium]